MATEIADQALERIHRALAPAGWLIFGVNAPPRDALEEALVSLRLTRSGGHPWTPMEVEERLRAHAYKQIEAFAPALPIRFVIARWLA